MKITESASQSRFVLNLYVPFSILGDLFFADRLIVLVISEVFSLIIRQQHVKKSRSMPHKMRATIEVFIGLICIFGYMWLIYPLYHLWIKIVVAIPILVFLFASNFTKHTRLHDLGFRWDNWSNSAKILLPFTIVTIPMLYGMWSGFFPVSSHFYAKASFWKRLLIYPFWALFQEYIMLAFFFRRYRVICSPYTTIAILCSACTFSLIHFPTPPLLILCFVSGMMWAGTYHTSPNLYTIAISHALLGTFCSYILLVYSIVGPDADIGRWSKKQPPVVQGAIEHVNALTLDRKDRLITLNHETKSLEIEGWVITTEPIEQIHLRLGENMYAVHYGITRQDIAARFQNPEYLYSGFHATIPLSDVAPGYHPLVLRVSLHGAFFSHAPGKKRWVHIL